MTLCCKDNFTLLVQLSILLEVAQVQNAQTHRTLCVQHCSPVPDGRRVARAAVLGPEPQELEQLRPYLPAPETLSLGISRKCHIKITCFIIRDMPRQQSLSGHSKLN